MPIYEYRCTSCGFQKEYLQKISDPLLTVCPECSKETFGKMLTAAGFQLKGSGWYATDFKHSGSKPAAKSGGDSAGGDSASGAGVSATDSSAAAKPDGAASGATAPAAAPVAASSAPATTAAK